jgi:acetyl-CoA acyltransferase
MRALSTVRPDDLAAHVIRELMLKNKNIDPEKIDDVMLGCANQAGEDNRNVSRMAVLLSGLPSTVTGNTVNRLCGSGLDAILIASRSIIAGQSDLIIAGGVESMTRAPFVMPKAQSAFSRVNNIEDTTIGWRFVNAKLQAMYGTESMPETAENVAEEFNISRIDQDKYALRSQEKASIAQKNGRFKLEITPVIIPQRKGEDIIFSNDEHPRETTLDKLSSLPTPFKKGGSITAGNASGVNDGAAALIIASEQAVKDFSLNPLARISGGATGGVDPRVMGIGPVSFR